MPFRIKSEHLGKLRSSGKKERRREKNDVDRDINVRVCLSTFEDLKSAKLGDKLTLSARRIDEDGIIIRIVDINENDDDWTK